MSGENGSQFDYKFGTKNNWRRCVWNRITERLFVKPRDAIVLYLAGEMDLDRKIAKEHGFRDENMIAVERDKDVCAKLRSEGKLAVFGDLFQTLYQWSGPKIDVVFGDFCGNISVRTIVQAQQFPLISQTPKTVVAFNFLKGRELLRHDLLKAAVIGKHRGEAVFDLYTDSLTKYIQWGRNWTTDSKFDQSLQDKCRSAGEYFFTLNPLKQWFGSYMSTSGQVFDSVVWRHWSLDGYYQDAIERKIKVGSDHGHNCFGFSNGETHWDKKSVSAHDPKSKLARQITAVRAVRTHKIAVRQAGNN